MESHCQSDNLTLSYSEGPRLSFGSRYVEELVEGLWINRRAHARHTEDLRFDPQPFWLEVFKWKVV